MKVVKDFLSTHLKKEGPLLIGLSGGEDSSALLSLLLECRSFFSLDLHVAHFDHAWREESQAESFLLQDYVKQFSLPFHLERSQGSSETSNLEEKARDERFLFFQRVYKKIGAQALVLAHQRDDQAETVLKRIFEGSGLLSLGGMEFFSLYEEMEVWRPLLSIPREEIEKWNENKSWVPFKDRTNLDLKFLRPRMREELFPLLEERFGKNIRHSLFRVGQELALFKSSFQRKIELNLAQSEKGVFGSVLSFTDLGLEDPFEQQETVRLFLRQHGGTVSSDVLKKIVLLLDQNLSNKELDVSFGEVLIERGSLFWLKKIPKSFLGQVSLKEAFFSVTQGDQTWEIRNRLDSCDPPEESLLCSFLKGEITYRIKEGSESLLFSYDQLTEKDQKTISGYLAKNKVPAKMKKMFPFVINDGRLVECDFCFNLDSNYKSSSVFSNIILKM